MKRKLKACSVVHHRIEYDNRVLRHNQSLKKIGIEPVIICLDIDSKIIEEFNYFGIKVKVYPKEYIYKFYHSIYNYLFLIASNISKFLSKFYLIKIIKKSDYWIIKNFKSITSRYFIEPLIKLVFIVLGYLTELFFYTKLTKVLINEQADIYIANDLPTLHFCYKSAKKNKSILVYDSHELFLETLKTGLNKSKGINKLYNFAHYLGYKLKEKLLINKANLIITVNDTFSNYFAKKYNIIKPLVIRNIFEYQKVKSRALFHKHFSIPKNNKIILHQGGLVKGRGIETIIRSLKKLPKDYSVVLMGYRNVDYYKKYAKKHKLSQRVYFHPAVNKKKLIQYTASADIGCILTEGQKKDLNKYYSLPNKVFEYMMAGLPIIASDLPEIRRIILKEKTGVLIKNPRSVKQFAEAVLTITNKDTWNRYHENAIKSSKNKLNWEIEEKKLIREYKRMLNHRQ